VSLQSDLFLFFPHSFDRPAKYWHIDLAFMMRKQTPSGLNKRVTGIEPVQEAAAAAREAQSREVAGLQVWAL